MSEFYMRYKFMKGNRAFTDQCVYIWKERRAKTKKKDE